MGPARNGQSQLPFRGGEGQDDPPGGHLHPDAAAFLAAGQRHMGQIGTWAQGETAQRRGDEPPAVQSK